MEVKKIITWIVLVVGLLISLSLLTRNINSDSISVQACSYIKIEEDGDYELYKLNEDGCWTYTQVLGGFTVESTVFTSNCTEEDIIAIIGINMDNFIKEQ